MTAILGIGAIFLLAAPMASAQLPALPPLPIPAEDQSVATPVGTTDVSYADGKVHACGDYSAGTSTATGLIGQLPVQPPALPVPLPDANAAANACVDAAVPDPNAVLADPTSALPQVHVETKGHASYLGAAFDWFMSLF